MKTFSFAVATSLVLATSVAAEGKPGQHFVENWDLDGNGSVSLTEATERRSDIFATFDADEDGVLNGEEYDAFDEARRLDMEENAGGEAHGKGGMKKVQQGMKREFNDTNKDGVVSKEEFLGSVPAWFEMMDSSGDGQVDSSDFGKKK